MRATLLIFLAATFAAAQTTPPPQNFLDPDQRAYQQAVTTYNTQAEAFRAAAKAALFAESQREKDAICPAAMDIPQISDCIAHENALTTANYQAFTSALRSLLALPQPPAPGGSYPVQGISGPQAIPVSSVTPFDASESAWQPYAKAECSAVDSQWHSAGPSDVNIYVGECTLRHSRARMHELAGVYISNLRLD
jgi:hypothetical protein